MHSKIMAEKTTNVLDKASCHAAYTASHVTTTHVLDKASCHAAYTASHVPSEIMTEKTTNVLDKASCHAAYTASHVPTTHVLDKASCHAAYTASHVPLLRRVTQAVLWFLRSGLAMLLWGLCMLCVGAMRQSHATASLSQPRNRRLLSRTNTTAAELFLLAPYAIVRSGSNWKQGWQP